MSHVGPNCERKEARVHICGNQIPFQIDRQMVKQKPGVEIKKKKTDSAREWYADRKSDKVSDREGYRRMCEMKKKKKDENK